MTNENPFNEPPEAARARRMRSIMMALALGVFVVLVFIVLLTCVPSAGFMTAAIVAIVLAVLGWVFLKKKPDASH